jgi:hypothetical protein
MGRFPPADAQDAQTSAIISKMNDQAKERFIIIPFGSGEL